MGKNPIGSTHMNIQWKFLSIAAYEGFVHNINTVHIEQCIEQSYHWFTMQDVNVNGVKAYPMVFPHTTNKETLRQRNDIQ